VVYDIRRRLAGKGDDKLPGVIYDEEGDVFDSLKWGGYLMASHAPDEPQIRWHWTPCHELYDNYLRYMRAKRWAEKVHLTAIEFGVALRAVYELEVVRKKLVMQDDKGRTVRRHAYLGFKGPKSFFRRPHKGRPRKDV
jgi:hypothetical protein